MLPNRTLLVVALLTLSLVAAPAFAEASGSISAADVLSSWSDEPAPQWNQAPVPVMWGLTGDRVVQIDNGAGTLVSPFGFSGDFTFSATLRAIPEPDEDQDDDNMGLVFGWQDESNHYRIGWEGGGFGDNGNEFDPFAEEGASGAHGLFLVREQGGVGTVLAELSDTFWEPETDYGFVVGRIGTEIHYEVSEGMSVIASGTVDDATFTSGAIGIYVESQEAEFGNLFADKPSLLACPVSPLETCVDAAKASLAIKESKPGSEKLKAKLAGIASATTPEDFGDPAAGEGEIGACVYDDADQLVGALTVNAGGACAGKPCWKASPGKGFAYKDKGAADDGVQKLAVKTGDAGKGAFQIQAGNKASKGLVAYPVGIAAALEGTTSVRLQVVTLEEDCFEATLDAVKTADGEQVSAKSQ